MPPKGKRKRYTKAPTIPAELQPLYQAILEVMAGKSTVSEAARHGRNWPWVTDRDAAGMADFGPPSLAQVWLWAGLPLKACTARAPASCHPRGQLAQAFKAPIFRVCGRSPTSTCRRTPRALHIPS